jgi:hypothetical protein
MIFPKFMKVVAAVTAPAMIWTFFGYRPVRAASDNNGSQDEKQMIQAGLTEASNLGIKLTITTQDSDLVGLGSYIVDITSACNICYSPVFITTSFTTNGNPYLLPPVFSGRKQADPRFYLGGNQKLRTAGAGFCIDHLAQPDSEEEWPARRSVASAIHAYY